MESVRFYHEHNRWFARLFLVMPDHVHALLAFPPDEKMSDVIQNWKSYIARACSVKWQRGYFDHRVRNGENWELKAAYIRQNPVRKGLVACGEKWPYVFEA